MLIQLLLNGILTASIYSLIGLGFALIYNTTRFFHFAHGAVYTAGAYMVYAFNIKLGIPLAVSLPFAVIGSALLGILMELVVYRPLRRREANPLILLIASLGMYIVLQNLISLFFGDDTKTVRSGVVKEGINVLGAYITPVQISIIVVSALLVITTWLILTRTKTGKLMRAVANDPWLAEASGIDSDRVILATFAIGSALAGFAGILVSLDIDMTPTMGMNALMMGVVAVIVGGVGSIPGVVLGALLLGMAQHLGVWKISSQWQDAIAFVVLLTFLIFRPQGFLGKKISKVEV